MPTRESFGRLLAIVDHGAPVPEVDLLIRTGGERRLSDFLLWEAAYAELLFSPLMWPEFGPEALRRAVARLRRARAALRRPAGRGGRLTMTTRTRQGLVLLAAGLALGLAADALQRLVPARLDATLGIGAFALALVALAQCGVVALPSTRSLRSGRRWPCSASR